MAFVKKMTDRSAKDHVRPFKLSCNAPDHLCLSSPYYANCVPAKSYKGKRKESEDD